MTTGRINQVTVFFVCAPASPPPPAPSRPSSPAPPRKGGKARREGRGERGEGREEGGRIAAGRRGLFVSLTFRDRRVEGEEEEPPPPSARRSVPLGSSSWARAARGWTGGPPRSKTRRPPSLARPALAAGGQPPSPHEGGRGGRPRRSIGSLRVVLAPVGALGTSIPLGRSPPPPEGRGGPAVEVHMGPPPLLRREGARERGSRGRPSRASPFESRRGGGARARPRPPAPPALPPAPPSEEGRGRARGMGGQEGRGLLRPRRAGPFRRPRFHYQNGTERARGTRPEGRSPFLGRERKSALGPSLSPRISAHAVRSSHNEALCALLPPLAPLPAAARREGRGGEPPARGRWGGPPRGRGEGEARGGGRGAVERGASPLPPGRAPLAPSPPPPSPPLRGGPSDGPRGL